MNNLPDFPVFEIQAQEDKARRIKHSHRLARHALVLRQRTDGVFPVILLPVTRNLVAELALFDAKRVEKGFKPVTKEDVILSCEINPGQTPQNLGGYFSNTAVTNFKEGYARMMTAMTNFNEGYARMVEESGKYSGEPPEETFLLALDKEVTKQAVRERQTEPDIPFAEKKALGNLLTMLMRPHNLTLSDKAA